MRVRLIVNPRATGVRAGTAEAVARVLAAAAEVETVSTEGPGHARALAGAPADGVVALGGDGTANEVVNGVAAGTPVGVLPGGASSIFARQLGFPRALLPAAGELAEAIAARRTRAVGLGEADGRRFTFAAGIGLDAEIVAEVDRMRSLARGGRRPSDAAFLAAALRVLARSGFRLRERLTVQAAGGFRARGAFVLVANQHPYTYLGRLPVRAAPAARFDAGLDAVVAGALAGPGLWRLPVYGLVWARHVRGRDAAVRYLHDLTELTVRCDAPTAVQLDGEHIGERERLELRSAPGAAVVYVPAVVNRSPPARARAFARRGR